MVWFPAKTYNLLKKFLYYAHKSLPNPNPEHLQKATFNPWYSSMLATQKMRHHTTQKMLRTLQNGLYFVNIYRNITDINFHPLHMSILYRCNRKKKKLNPILRSETSLTENKAPVSDKLQQCRKSSHRKVPCQDPWDSGNDHRAKWKSSAGT